ncbi:hypothetical protein COV42_02625 [Candidatus Campbellbacteria bacterium CG11_big_fil_rev_8_21_14_0_20_44_21]|uniref:Uncharacterized protein n=1 Tax=Candidatus Campbellbacteria bacterium CG22_combo_CG10-13_8_21_14_all_43_18 TaxID=1974530 RepID=A0A2H0DX11_9BACT|nr:MAG: hypothetical protein COW82_00700 [Candidatus Campbellbacteria bacterium CG22_combo_CG10-13_8_21_14_all_43_18]PIR24115.1 MAG: hypothetical protein COV42_02625 [Candidatus Campbellbacteria bacterium CG11_big_fil_rev_8_21_14_0_20_44_21]
MGAEQISDQELTASDIDIVGKTDSGSRKLKIPSESIERYKNLIREKMTPGFWNEFLDENDIHFIFKFENNDTKEYVLSPESEQEIDDLCAKLNNEPPDKTANVYKYISENDFYRDFMMTNYKVMIER